MANVPMTSVQLSVAGSFAFKDLALGLQKKETKLFGGPARIVIAVSPLVNLDIKYFI